VAFLAALFFLPRHWWAALAAIIVAAGAHEWARLCRLGNAAAWSYTVAIAAALGLLFLAGSAAAFIALLAASAFWIVFVPIWLVRGVASHHRAGLVIAGILVLVPAGYALAVLEPRIVLAVLVLVWVADTAAYFVGRKWGRHKLAPSISPGKTWEGAWGGAVAATAYAIICGTFLLGAAGWPAYLAVAALLAAISIVGDLFESAAKRQAGVKDSGALLPGHGGIMDRIDSATAVLPVAALLLALPRP
jgi:phosphatidate cytidylyltransferase